MKEQVKQLRLEIDGLAQLCEGLKPFKGLDCYKILPSLNSGEILEAVKSLKLSKAWLGKVLESLGSENPYGSGYKTVEDIVPETDKITGVPLTIQEAIDYNKMSHIEKVDWLRTKVRSLIEKVSAPRNYVIDLSKIGGSVNLEKYIEKLNSMGIQFLDSKDNMKLESLPMNKVKEHLTEARFWLGFELGRIRDESK